MSRLVVTNANMHALAVISILEGAANLRDTSEQLKVAAVIINRINSSNWRREFGDTIIDQVMGTSRSGQRQFVVIDHYHVVRSDFDSLAATVARLDTAKHITYAGEIVEAFVRAIGTPDGYSAARTAVGDKTGFRAGSNGNVFRNESRYDDSDLATRHPMSVVPQTPMYS